MEAPVAVAAVGTLALVAVIAWVEGREWLARKRAARLDVSHRR